MKLPDWRRLLIPRKAHPQSVAPGLYHFFRDAEGRIVRFHLRVDESGAGVLVANAVAVARLSPVGVFLARELLEGRPPEKIVSRAKKLFRGVSLPRLAADLKDVLALIARLQSPQSGYPIINLADPAFSLRPQGLDRPLAADVLLCGLERLLPLLSRLWEMAIPHVTLLVGRRVEKSQILRAVERAEDLGLITGLRGKAGNLAVLEPAEAADVGLDHLDVMFFSAQAEVHDRLAGQGDWAIARRLLLAAREAEICPVAQLALTHPTLAGIEETFSLIAELGVENVCLFALATEKETPGAAEILSADELPPAARIVEEAAERRCLRLFWQPTMRYDASRPLGEQACAGPRCGSDFSIRVCADGAVIPPRGPYRSAGNLLMCDWPAIAAGEAFAAYRRRLESDTHCATCPGLAICAVDCPREPAGWAEPAVVEEEAP